MLKKSFKLKIKLITSFFVKASTFVTNDSIHGHYTSGCRNIHLERCRTRKRQLTVLHQGPKMWNSLSAHLRESPSVNVFIKKIKTFLINNLFNIFMCFRCHHFQFFFLFCFFSVNFVLFGKKGNYRLGIINFLINLNTLVIIDYFDL